MQLLLLALGAQLQGRFAERLQLLEAMLAGIPETGEGVDKAWLESHWGLKDAKRRINTLADKGRLRERHEAKPGGGSRNLYWAIPPVEKTPVFDRDEEEDEPWH